MYWNLIKLRKENNMTQLDMAQLIGVKEYQTYGNKELGKTKFNLKEVIIIQKHFNKPLDYIFFAEESI